MKMLIVFAAIFAIGESTDCYVCSACNRPFDSEAAGIFNCSIIPGAVCYKEVIEFRNGKEVFFRGCTKFPPISSNNTTTRSIDDTKGIVSVRAYFCNSQLCNDTQSLQPGSVLVFIVGVLLLRSR